MKVYQELSKQVAYDARRRVAERATRELRKMPAGLSGDDSGLRTIWEEFCVQVQGEESFFWDFDVETVKLAIAGALVNVRRLEMIAMWLECEGAWHWLAENDEGSALPGVFQPDVVDWVYESVWQLADGSRHPRVVRHLAREGDFD